MLSLHSVWSLWHFWALRISHWEAIRAHELLCLSATIIKRHSFSFHCSDGLGSRHPTNRLGAGRVVQSAWRRIRFGAGGFQIAQRRKFGFGKELCGGGHVKLEFPAREGEHR